MSTPTTFGDPEAIRAFANEILGRAELIAQTPAGLAKKFDDATFEGPAADRLRTATTDARLSVVDTADELRSIATALLADAAEVERMNAAAAAEAAAAAATQGAGAGDSTPPGAASVSGTPASGDTPAAGTPSPDAVTAPSPDSGVPVSVDPVSPASTPTDPGQVAS